jgi:hypothetical protein
MLAVGSRLILLIEDLSSSDFILAEPVTCLSQTWPPLTESSFTLLAFSNIAAARSSKLLSVVRTRMIDSGNAVNGFAFHTQKIEYRNSIAKIGLMHHSRFHIDGKSVLCSSYSNKANPTFAASLQASLLSHVAFSLCYPYSRRPHIVCGGSYWTTVQNPFSVSTFSLYRLYRAVPLFCLSEAYNKTCGLTLRCASIT